MEEFILLGGVPMCFKKPRGNMRGAKAKPKPKYGKIQVRSAPDAYEQVEEKVVVQISRIELISQTTAHGWETAAFHSAVIANPEALKLARSQIRTKGPDDWALNGVSMVTENSLWDQLANRNARIGGLRVRFRPETLGVPVLKLERVKRGHATPIPAHIGEANVSTENSVLVLVSSEPPNSRPVFTKVVRLLLGQEAVDWFVQFQQGDTFSYLAAQFAMMIRCGDCTDPPAKGELHGWYRLAREFGVKATSNVAQLLEQVRLYSTCKGSTQHFGHLLVLNCELDRSAFAKFIEDAFWQHCGQRFSALLLMTGDTPEDQRECPFTRLLGTPAKKALLAYNIKRGKQGTLHIDQRAKKGKGQTKGRSVAQLDGSALPPDTPPTRYQRQRQRKVEVFTDPALFGNTKMTLS